MGTQIKKILSTLIFIVITCFLFTALVLAEEHVLSVIINGSDDKTIEQCVLEVNKNSDSNLDTATRLYLTGTCYFCIACDFEADNGEIFTVQDLGEFVSDQNYETAHKLITQAAGLGNAKAYYSLAILTYVEDLHKKRKSRIDITEKYISSMQNDIKQLNFQVNKNSDEFIDEEEAQQRIEKLESEIYKKQHRKDFSADIHRNMLVAAKQGYAPAQFALSEIYYNGIGVSPDVIQAYAWAATAVAQNPPFGSIRRDEKATSLNALELNEANAIAEEYMKKYTAIFDSSSFTIMR